MSLGQFKTSRSRSQVRLDSPPRHPLRPARGTLPFALMPVSGRPWPLRQPTGARQRVQQLCAEKLALLATPGSQPVRVHGVNSILGCMRLPRPTARSPGKAQESCAAKCWACWAFTPRGGTRTECRKGSAVQRRHWSDFLRVRASADRRRTPLQEWQRPRL